MKNLIVRGEYGRVIDFRKGLGNKIDDYKWLEAEGYVVEATDDYYTRKFGRWWITEKPNE